MIASQALITGSYTLVSEAIRLDLLPHLEIRYPSDTKGQLYIGTVNGILWIGCSLIVLYFRSGARMEAAYGLAITVTMLMTTLLITVYLWRIRNRKAGAGLVLLAFGLVESIFLISSLGKFTHGGYVTVILTLLLLLLMIIWYRGTELEHRFSTKLRLCDHVPSLVALHDDDNIPLLANNLVYLEGDADPEVMDRDILYSILDKDTKRAQAYWFLSIHVVNDPNTAEYELNTYDTDCIFRIRLLLGFKRSQRVNLYLRQIVEDLQKRGELPPQEKKYSIYGQSSVGTFKFCIIHKSVSTKTVLSGLDEMILNAKYSIRRLAGSKVRWYGLDTSSLIIENVPLVPGAPEGLQRIVRKENSEDSRRPLSDTIQ